MGLFVAKLLQPLLADNFIRNTGLSRGILRAIIGLAVKIQLWYITEMVACENWFTFCIMVHLIFHTSGAKLRDKAARTDCTKACTYGLFLAH